MTENEIKTQSEIPEETHHYKVPHWGWRALEIAAVAAGVAYAIIAYFMWRESHDNFILEQRAWLNVSKVELMAKGGKDFHTGSPIIGEVTLSNTGKTPAKQVQSEYRIVLLRNNEEVQFDYGPPIQESDFIGFLSPNDSTVVGVHKYVNKFDIETLTEKEMYDIVNGRTYIAIYGRTKYTDIFGRTHWFKHCSWHGFHAGGSYDAGTCTNYNDTGDGEFPPDAKPSE